MASIEHAPNGNFRASQGAFEVSEAQATTDVTESGSWQLERDADGRIWYDIPGSKVMPAALTETSPRRAVLTKGGRQFLSQLERDDRRRVLEGGIDHKLSGEYMHFWGTEGHIRKVDDLPPGPGWLQTIVGALRNTNSPIDRSQAQVTAVEKTFQQKGALYGWEMAYLLDQLHLVGKDLPEAIQHVAGLDRFRVLQPIGGTHRCLYMPYLDGVTLDDFFDPMFELHPVFAKKLVQPVHEYTSKVRRAMQYSLVMILDQLSYQVHEHKYYQFNYLDGYTHFFHKDAQGVPTFLDLYIDIHPMGSHPYDRYRNWMMTQENVTACWQIAEDSRPDSDKVEQIASLITENAIMFDPLYIRQRRGRK